MAVHQAMATQWSLDMPSVCELARLNDFDHDLATALAESSSLDILSSDAIDNLWNLVFQPVT